MAACDYLTSLSFKGADYVSLYLSAEPTSEERERGLKSAATKPSSNIAQSSISSNSLAAVASGKQSGTGGSASTNTSTTSPWVRDGAYRFVFEIRLVGKKDHAPIKTMEAADHVFSSEARNWGWQSFARRNDVYFNNLNTKTYDECIIACTITYSPANPSPAPYPNDHKKMVPLQLLDAFAGLFNNPTYSDVKFVVRFVSKRKPLDYVAAELTDGT